MNNRMDWSVSKVYSWNDKEGIKELRKEWEQTICPDTDKELIARFNSLSKNIRNREFSYGVIMSVYMSVMQEELEKRFDISEIVKYKNVEDSPDLKTITSFSYKDQIYLNGKKVYKKGV